MAISLVIDSGTAVADCFAQVGVLHLTRGDVQDAPVGTRRGNATRLADRVA